MRYFLNPSASSSPGSSQEVANTHKCTVQLVIQNVGGVPIWFSDNRESLDGSLAPDLTPQVGFMLPPNSPPFPIDRFNGVLYARAQAFGGAVECQIFAAS